jgi:NADPH-dependent 2,4-dienoyl-CoA reductase/sulfur reductase-like enzyme
VREHLVVVGASRAGLFAVEEARRRGFEGRVTLVGAESVLPYDRPPLSKEFLDPTDTEPALPIYRSADGLRERLGVDIRLGTRATGLDPDKQAIWLDDETLTYTGLVIATGATPRTLRPFATGVEGILPLRTADDARRLRTALKACPRTVVVGAGLIGSEVAAAARKRRLPVTIVEALPTPMARVVGDQVGKVCARLHERHGANLLTGVHVTAVQGVNHVEGVWLSDGRTLDADLVVVGVGVEPATSWLAHSGLRLDDGIVCDETLGTGAPGVYAAGDVVRWHNPKADRLMRLENWTSAAEQGRLAARNALDPSTAETYATVPYVWSDQYDTRLQFVGTAEADEIVTVDDRDEDDAHLALYRTGDRLTGAFGLGRPRIIPKLRTMIRRGVTFDDVLAWCAAQ